MDLQPTHYPEATSSASTSSAARPDIHNQDPATASETKVLRSSARVKAAKQKYKPQASEKAKECDSIPAGQLPSSSTAPPNDTAPPRATRAAAKSKRAREEVSGKGNATESAEEVSRSNKRSIPIDCHLDSNHTNLEIRRTELVVVQHLPLLL